MNFESFDIMFIAIRCPTFVSTTGTKWGLEHENVALNELFKHLHMPCRRSELIINPEHPFFGASPDALFDEDAIAKIKFPYSIKDMSPQATRSLQDKKS
ncbi:hypothetical protein PR048_005546 [Dryococelus australis]|uniref:YqaJ viral recombinase domain-containing protein n=1 Tax=Dryococelus australis TaxID=614101 RepID=A0ABQ9I8F7_9NEOP|nr:hypothetical protein PR048_005546 [Dryococelus australis]